MRPAARWDNEAESIPVPLPAGTATAVAREAARGPAVAGDAARCAERGTRDMTPNIRRNERLETGGVRSRNRLVAAALRLSLLLTALVVSTLALPVTALAAEGAPNTLYVGNQNVKSGEDTTYWATTDNGELELVEGASDTSNNWNVKYDPSTATLTLRGASIQGGSNTVSAPYGSGIYALSRSGQPVSLTIELIGTNTITGNYGIYVDAEQGETVGANASLLIRNSSDNGILEVSGSSHGIYIKSGTGNASLTINDASVVAKTTQTYSGYAGVYVQSGASATTLPQLSLAVNGGSLTTSGTESSDGILFYVGSSQATGATTSLTVSDNAIVRAENGIKASRVDEPTPSGTGIVFDGKDGTVYGNVTLQEDLEISEGETLTIPEDSSLDMGGHTITVENGGKLDGTPTGNGTVIDKSSPVSYLDENGAAQTCDNYEVVTANDTQWTDGWYVVNSDVTINRRVDVSGDVKLILTNGHTLTVNGGIHVTGNDCFTVYGQENGTGKLTATETNHVGAGIGGNGRTTIHAQDGENGGTIIIAGGTIKAVGGDTANNIVSPCGGAGIGNGNGASNGGSVTIYGGKVNATGRVANAGIGGDGSTIQILGGTVEATSGGGAAAIGGTNGTAGTITITESNVTANGEDGTGIGGGCEDHGGTITITNSTVTAIGGGGAGIGGGAGLPGSAAGGNGGNVTIVNSTVTASSKEGDSIGAGRNGAAPDTLTLSPADGKAIAAKAGADEASALALNGSPFTAATAVTDLVRGTKYFHSEPCNIYTVTVNDSYAQTTGAGNYAEGATVAIDAGTRSGYTFDGWTSADGVTFANAGSTQTTFTMPANNVTITASWRYDPPYVPPAKTPSEQALEKIGAADDGDTVTVRLPAGDTVLDAEVFEALAGRDVTLVLEMDGNVAWEIMGTDVPAGASYENVDMGVSLGGDAIPVNVVNLVTGECGGVQVALEHDGPFGFKATLVAPLGEDVAGMYGNLYRYDGDAEALDFETSGMVDEDGTARLVFDHASLWLIALDTRSHALPFADTGEDLWYSEAVRWAWRHGVMTGYADGSESFGTNDSLTRAQMAAVLYNVAGKPDADVSGLPGDCDGGTWYATCVSWALETGVFNGYGDGSSFGPDDPLTREQAACVLMNAASALGADVSARADLSQYPDADEVSAWASDALSWAVAEGVLSGVETGDGARELQPSRACTRAEMAALMMNLSARSAE